MAIPEAANMKASRIGPSMGIDDDPSAEIWSIVFATAFNVSLGSSHTHTWRIIKISSSRFISRCLIVNTKVNLSVIYPIYTSGVRMLPLVTRAQHETCASNRSKRTDTP
jgi:hypothetical protein